MTDTRPPTDEQPEPAPVDVPAEEQPATPDGEPAPPDQEQGAP